MTLSIDLRSRVGSMVHLGASRRGAARHFKIGVSSAIRFVKQVEELGHLRPQIPKRRSKLDPFTKEIFGRIEAQPDLTLREISAMLLEQHGMSVAISTLHNWVHKNKVSYKKTAHAAEQERGDVQAKRRAFGQRQAWVHAHPETLNPIVFIDETGVNTKMARLRGRCTRGQRLVALIPHGHWKTLTFIAGLRCDRITAPWGIDGPIDGDIFVEYIRTQLAPTLQKGDVVVLDNLSAHKRDEARKAIVAQGAWMLFLPPYSPDLNPIEMAFSKLKSHLKRMAVRTIDELWKAIGKICDLYTPTECFNYFKAAGYAPN